MGGGSGHGGSGHGGIQSEYHLPQAARCLLGCMQRVCTWPYWAMPRISTSTPPPTDGCTQRSQIQVAMWTDAPASLMASLGRQAMIPILPILELGGLGCESNWLVKPGYWSVCDRDSQFGSRGYLPCPYPGKPRHEHRCHIAWQRWSDNSHRRLESQRQSATLFSRH